MNNYMRNQMDRIIRTGERHSALGWGKFDFRINRVAEEAEKLVRRSIMSMRKPKTVTWNRYLVEEPVRLRAWRVFVKAEKRRLSKK